MPSISMRTGDRLTLGDGCAILVDAAQDGRVRLRVQAPAEVSVIRGEPARPAEQELRELARSIASDLSGLEAAHSQALLSGFVAELFRTAAENDRRAQRRQKQAQGIAAAKARGVRFGRAAKPVPDGFDQLHRAWREGRISLKKAAESCGMTRGTFYNVALRREQQEDSRAV